MEAAVLEMVFQIDFSWSAFTYPMPHTTLRLQEIYCVMNLYHQTADWKDSPCYFTKVIDTK